MAPQTTRIGCSGLRIAGKFVAELFLLCNNRTLTTSNLLWLDVVNL